LRKKTDARVKEVYKGSIADEAGIVPGDIINKINGEEIHDILEYKFLTSDEELELEVIKNSGDVEIISIYNEEYEDLGIVFENPLIDKAKFCSNKCIFCFIDQLPQNMRKTLYFKDDDSRLSFLQGNYVTLTNMSDRDISRIIKFRLSPINISVHTTNPELRIKMLGNHKAGQIMKQIRLLAQAHITMNCQIVLCRGINDGNELDRTLNDITSLYPHVNSVSVVPVGLTVYRDRLYELVPYNKESSLEVILQVEAWQKKLLRKYGSRIVFLADEFYIMASRPIPSYKHYEGFPQIENGVGLIASMQEEFNQGIKKLKKQIILDNRCISIATGVSAKSFIDSLVNKLQSKISGLEVKVHAIKNMFFGENVTVAGLVTGKDIINQLKGKELGSELLIPATMLRSDRDIFLDDTSIEDVEQALKVKVVTVENNGFDFIDKVIGTNNIDNLEE
jgi:putative radical SAM enzyme (TIGR03279 family)